MKWYFHLQLHTVNRRGLALRTGFTDRQAAPSELTEFCLVAPHSTSTCNYFDKYMQLLWQFCVISLTNTYLKKKKQSLQNCRAFFICSTFQGGRSCATRRLPKNLDLYWSFQFYHTLFSSINNICRNLRARLTQKHWIDSILLSSYKQNITSLHLGSDKKNAFFSQIGKYA